MINKIKSFIQRYLEKRFSNSVDEKFALEMLTPEEYDNIIFDKTKQLWVRRKKHKDSPFVRRIKIKWWFRINITNRYFYIRYGIKLEQGDCRGTSFASYGKNNYIEVKQRGPYLDIINHGLYEVPKGTIRIIPNHGNFGTMVEFLNENGEVRRREAVGYEDFMRLLNMNVECNK